MTVIPVRRSRPAGLAVLLPVAAVLLVGCSTSPGHPSDQATSSPGTARPHGFVAGASEAPEPQLRLLAVDARGTVAVHDLLATPDDGRPVGKVDPPTHSATDGRFLVTADADRTTFVDGGSWTVDHGDHTHYYRAEARVVGTVDGGGPVSVWSSEKTTTVFWSATGHGVAFDRDALGQGEVEVIADVPGQPHDGALLPLGDHLVVSDAAGSVRVLDAEGSATDVSMPCADPAGGATTRVGAVIGCADGAVLATDDDGDVRLERIARTDAGPASTPAPTSFAARNGRPTLAALAGDAGFWLLDTRERSWSFVPTDQPLRAVVAVDDADGHVVGIDTAGRVVVHTTEDGTVVRTEPLVPAEPGGSDGGDRDGDETSTGSGSGPRDLLQVDDRRAYVTDAVRGVVHEIDFADDARVARTIPVGEGVQHVAEVGR